MSGDRTKNAPQLTGIVIATGEPGLADAVRSLLRQSEPVETVVVSSGGTDPTSWLRAEGIRVPVAHQGSERLMPGGARNAGIRFTRAPFVGFLAADCLAQPGWAAARLRHHRAGAEAVASAIVNAAPGSASAWAAHLLLHHRRMPGTPPEDRLLYSLSYDRRLFDRFGLFREDLRIGEDSEFNFRIAHSVEVTWSDDIRTGHRYPEGPIALMREMLERGWRRRALLRAEGPSEWNPPTSPYRVLRNAGVALRHPATEPDPGGRRRRAYPLVWPGAAAYALGLVAGSLRPAPRRRGATLMPDPVAEPTQSR